MEAKYSSIEDAVMNPVVCFYQPYDCIILTGAMRWE